MTGIRSTPEELVRAARGGDREAFGEFVRGERDSLVMAARALTRDWHTAEDVVQDTFVAAFRNLFQLRDATRYRAWLMRILVRLALAPKRRTRRAVRLADPAGVPARPPGGDPRLDRIADEVEKLPEKYRVPVSLFYLAGLSYRQVAEVTGLTEKRVKSRLYDARERIRRSMSHGR